MLVIGFVAGVIVAVLVMLELQSQDEKHLRKSRDWIQKREGWLDNDTRFFSDPVNRRCLNGELQRHIYMLGPDGPELERRLEEAGVI